MINWIPIEKISNTPVLFKQILLYAKQDEYYSIASVFINEKNEAMFAVGDEHIKCNSEQIQNTYTHFIVLGKFWGSAPPTRH